jgi:hypothetical protein
MIILQIATFLTFLFLAIASLIDLKTGEIPEKISHGLFLSLIFLSLIPVVYLKNIMYILTPLTLSIIFFIISAVLFYLGQWGGGDVKLMASIGWILGLLSISNYQWPNMSLMPYSIAYWINMAFLSLPYVVIYTVALGLIQPAVFKRFASQFKDPKIIFITTFSFTPFIAAHFYGILILKLIYTLIPVFTLATIYLKTCESVALMREIRISDLKVADIVADDIIVDGEKIASKRNIEGVTEEQVKKIIELSAQGKIPEKIKIKWGVKFAPILLAALLATIYVGNFMEIIMYFLFSTY